MNRDTKDVRSSCKILSIVYRVLWLTKILDRNKIFAAEISLKRSLNEYTVVKMVKTAVKQN